MKLINTQTNKRKREKTEFPNIRNEREDIMKELTDI